jgi:hypothetical protein
MPIALHSNALVPRTTLLPRVNPLRMPAWPWLFWRRQVDTLRWLGRNDVGHWRSYLTPSVWRMTSLPRRLTKKLFREFLWFSNFSIICGHCWWKLLVYFKTFIYCEQLCNNAVNYPSTPSKCLDFFPTKRLFVVTCWFGMLSCILPVWVRILTNVWGGYRAVYRKSHDITSKSGL